MLIVVCVIFVASYTLPVVMKIEYFLTKDEDITLRHRAISYCLTLVGRVLITINSASTPVVYLGRVCVVYHRVLL